jgi:hypothetical protein
VIRVLGLVLRVLAVLFLVRLVLRFVVAAIRGARSAPRDAARSGELVRDRVCNTFIPRASALVASIHGEPAFFCSTTCRDRALLQ